MFSLFDTVIRTIDTVSISLSPSQQASLSYSKISVPLLLVRNLGSGSEMGPRGH